MDHAAVALTILVGTVALFVWNRLPVGVVAILTSVALFATGVLSADKALGGFGDPVVIFVASLFVVSEAIDATGVTTWAGQTLIARAGTGTTRLMTAVLVLCAGLTALITLNGSVAALLPMVVVLALRIGQPPSRLLMPLAFTGSAGSLLALSGSPVNVIVSNASREAGGGGFGFFDFAVLGVPLVIGTTVLCVLLSHRVLPHRRPADGPADLSGHAEALAAHYDLIDGFYRLRLEAVSPLVGQRPDGLHLDARYPDLTLIGVETAAGSADADHTLAGDDVLVVQGSQDQVGRLVTEQAAAVTMAPITRDNRAQLVSREMGSAEVVIPPRSPLVGDVVFPGMTRGPDLVILAVRRLGREQGPRHTELAEGDSVLVHGTWAAIEALASRRDVLLLDSPDQLRRQAVPFGPKAGRAVVVLAAMVALLAFDVVPPAMAGLCAATAMVLVRVLSVQQAYRSVSWQTVVLIGGLIPLSTAIQQSGAADLVARHLIDAVGVGRPYLLMVALFVMTGALGQVISNTATALIVTPVAVAAATETGVSVQPILMLIAVAGAASLLTPIATPANLMVMAPGGYRFGDYWRLGLPVMALWLGVALLVIPLVWHL